MRRVDLVDLSQTRYARGLRRDLRMIDGYVDYEIRPVRMPLERPQKRIFRALAGVEEWLWSGRGDVACGVAFTAAVLGLAYVLIRPFIPHG